MRHRALLVEIEEPQYGWKSASLKGCVVTINSDGTRVKNIGNEWGDDAFKGKHVLLDSDLEKLTLHAYIDLDAVKTTARVWGWGHYFDGHQIDLRQAERMIKVLRHVSKAVVKEERQYGYPTTAGAYFAVVARAVGAFQIVTLREKDGGTYTGDHGYDRHLWRSQEVGPGIDRINRLTSDYLEKALPAAEAAS